MFHNTDQNVGNLPNTVVEASFFQELGFIKLFKPLGDQVPFPGAIYLFQLKAGNPI